MSTAAPLPEDQLAALAGELEKHALYASGDEKPINHPTLRQEIERKTLTELQRLILALEHGKLAPIAFNAAVESLWMTVSGLVSKDIMELISTTKAQLVDADQYITRTYCNRERSALVVVSWQPGQGHVKVSRIADGKRSNSVMKVPDDAVIPSLEAKHKFNNVCEGLARQGWEQL